MKPRRKLTDREVNATVYHTLKDEGLLLPKTSEDIQILEDDFGRFPKGIMRAEDALRIAKTPHPLTSPSQSTEFAAHEKAVAEDLALAARNGGTIPPEIWAKMKIDRKSAEDERIRERQT